MIKHFEKLNNNYEAIDSNMPLSLSDAESDISLILVFEDYYRESLVNEDGVVVEEDVLPLSKEKLEEMNDLQNRIIDGFGYDIRVLLEVINEDNYEEIYSLADFLLERLQRNMRITQGIKQNMARKENNLREHEMYETDEDSLFVEAFFIQKLKELTNIDVLKLRK